MHRVEGVALPRDWGCINFVPLILTSSPCLPTRGFSLWNKLPSRWANSAPREQLCRPSLKTARDKSQLPTQAPALCTRISAFSSAGTAKTALVFATLLCRWGLLHKACVEWFALVLPLTWHLWVFARPLIPPWLLRSQRSLHDHRYVRDVLSFSHYFSYSCFLLRIPREQSHREGTTSEAAMRIPWAQMWLQRIAKEAGRDEEAQPW